MTTKCVIIDDEPLAIELMERHIAQLSQLELAATFKNAVAAFDYLKSNRVDLLFLDIQMPVLSGINFLKSTHLSPKVIFTTAYREYAMEGYELNVVDYLLKPITFERFLKAVDKYFEISPSPSRQPLEMAPAGSLTQEFIFVRADKKWVKIPFEELLYIESLKDYVKIRTADNTIVAKEKISDLEKQLPEEGFLRVHRSYLVNTRKITAYTQHDVELGAVEIPIGGLYKQQVLKLLNR